MSIPGSYNNYGNYNRGYPFTQMDQSGQDSKKKTNGKSPFAFYMMLIFVILVVIILIIIIVLYFRQQSALIDPANCPEKITGLVATSNAKISTIATNCGNNPNCTYTVASLGDAEQICLDLGTAKCKAFSLEQQPNTNNFTLTISSSINTVTSTGIDTYRLINI